MRVITLLLTAFLLSGCFVVLKNGDQVKVIGADKEIALDTLKKVEATPESAKRQINIFNK